MAGEGIFGLGLVTGKWIPYAIGGASSRICLKISEDLAERLMTHSDAFNKRIDGLVGRVFR